DSTFRWQNSADISMAIPRLYLADARKNDTQIGNLQPPSSPRAAAVSSGGVCCFGGVASSAVGARMAKKF
ncbi:hypothetical protein ACW9FA_30205, partial [Mycolicibacterium fortuitum]